MDPDRPLRLPRPEAFAPERPEANLVDVRAAIDIVANGFATRVTVAGLAAPEELAGIGLALAQAAGVDFALERDEETGAVTVVVGPLTRS